MEIKKLSKDAIGRAFSVLTIAMFFCFVMWLVFGPGGKIIAEEIGLRNQGDGSHFLRRK